MRGERREARDARREARGEVRRGETRRGEAKRGEEKQGEERRGEESRGEKRRVNVLIVVCWMSLVVLVVSSCFVLAFFSVWVLCGCACGALLYESPGGNQVDGLPPALHVGREPRHETLRGGSNYYENF